MKVVILGNGEVIHTVRWANGLSAAGVQVVLLTAHGRSRLLSKDVRVFRLLAPPPAGYYLNAPQAVRIVCRENPDLLHVHYASGYGTLGRLIGFKPTVLSVWGSDVYDFPATPRRRNLLVKNLRSAASLCSTSRVMAGHVHRLCPLNRPIAITPFGVDTNVFVPPGAQDRAGGGIVIGTVKKLTPTYGIDILIRGFALCIDRLARHENINPDTVRLRIVGDGPSRKDLVRLADRLGIASRTRFVDAVAHDRVPDELQQLDVFAAVSRQESFGVAVLEASACELPTVVSDVGGLPEVVKDGVTGLVVPAEDPDALADALLRLILRDSLRQDLGVAGRRHVQDQFEWKRCVNGMLEVYEVVLNRRQKAA